MREHFVLQLPQVSLLFDPAASRTPGGRTDLIFLCRTAELV